MNDEFSPIFEAPIDAPPDLDTLVQATMAWHFGRRTASPYWAGRRDSLGFDPLADVKTFDDLELFRRVPVDWAKVRTGDLAPAGCRDNGTVFGVYESGGTTGPPKRIVDAVSRRRNVEFQSALLDEQGFPRGPGGWLHVGPSGPHVMGKNIANLAAMRGFLCHYIDLDPRWVRRCLSQGRQDLFWMYVDHLLDQVRDVLTTQNIVGMSSTPPMFEQMAGRDDLREILATSIRGVIWGGTSIDGQTLQLLETELFAGAVVAGAYGNTMMGVAPQRTRRDGDPAPCIFRPFYPYSVVEVVDPADPGRPAAEGAPGRVRITALTRELFVPPLLERDQAARWNAPDGFAGPDISGVRPNQEYAGLVIEGVY